MLTIETNAPGWVVAELRAAGCVFAEAEAKLLLGAADSPEQLRQLVGRRATGEPLEYVVGWAEFHGLRIVVEPGVFVPRRRTELLVSVALLQPATTIVDLCCGAGALGAAVASRIPAARVYAADIDPVAVACARRNLAPYGGTVFLGDLYAALPEGLRGRVETLLVNAPYVPTADIAFLPPEAREHEPLVTLDGGVDGLDVLRRVIEEAPAWLAPGGRLLFEVNERQADIAVAVVAARGLAPAVVTDDGTCVVTGRQPSRLST